MRGLTNVVALGLALVAGAGLTPAAAVTAANTPISFTDLDVGQGAYVAFNGIVSGVVAAGLNAELVFTLAEVSADNRAWEFTLDRLTNTTSPGTSRVIGFGMNVATDTGVGLGSAAATGSFANTYLNVSPPQFSQSFSVCFRASSQGGCNGGGPNGVFPAVDGAGSFTLNFASAVNEVTLNDFFVRYQSIEGVPDVPRGASAVGVAVVLEAIPEPSSWAMLIAGFGLVGASMRRRRMVAA